MPFKAILIPRPNRARDNNLGAEDGIRTRDFDLGKVALYHWVTPAETAFADRATDGYWWEQQGSNLWPFACKANALPAELCSQEYTHHKPECCDIV